MSKFIFVFLGIVVVAKCYSYFKLGEINITFGEIGQYITLVCIALVLRQNKLKDSD